MAVRFSSKQVLRPLIRLIAIAALFGLPSISLLLHSAPALAEKTTKSIWSVFRSEDGGFSLLMPGQPITSSSDGVTSYSITRAKESVTYTVSYTDFPINPAKEANGIQNALAGVKTGIVEEGGKIQQQQTINLKGFPGEELRVVMPDGALTRLRSYIVGKRLYLIMASTDNERNLKRSLQGFLDSFRVNPEVVPEALPQPTDSSPSSFVPPLPATPDAPSTPEGTPTPAATPTAEDANEPLEAPEAAPKTEVTPTPDDDPIEIPDAPENTPKPEPAASPDDDTAQKSEALNRIAPNF